MKADRKKKLKSFYHMVEKILLRVFCVAVAVVFILDLIIELFTAPWYRILVTGLLAWLFSFIAWKSLDLRPEYRVEDTGIWFRDYKALIPYALMERAEYCSFPERTGTGYEVDLFLSPAALLDGQLESQKLLKQLKRENKLRMIFMGEEKEIYDSLCKALAPRIPMKDVTDEPFPE